MSWSGAKKSCQYLYIAIQGILYNDNIQLNRCHLFAQFGLRFMLVSLESISKLHYIYDKLST